MVLTKEQILDKLWDCDGNYIDSSTLTVYIRRLRIKIEDNPSEPQMLLTVRGMGYKWNVIRWGGLWKYLQTKNQKIVSCSIRYLGSLPSVDTGISVVVLSAVFFVPIACFRIGRRSDIGSGQRLFQKQNQVMEQAVSQLHAYLDGDHNARIECDEEGELYRLFHTVNSMAAVLNAHADNELREKEIFEKYNLRHFTPTENTAGCFEYL